MSKPFSFRTEPWTSFDKQSYSIFTDDFVHEKLLTVKVSQKPGRGTINLKESAERKGDAYKTSGEIKVWFPIWNSRSGHLYFRAKNNEIKVHYDDGLKATTVGDFNYYNLYTSFQSEKNFKNVVLKAGANLLAKSWNVDNRVRVGFSEAGETDVETGHKFGYVKENWSFDSFDVFCWKSKALVNNAIRVAYHKGDNDFFFRAENKTVRSFKGLDFTNLDTYFTKFIFDYVRKIDDLTKVAIEVPISLYSGRILKESILKVIPSRSAIDPQP